LASADFHSWDLGLPITFMNLPLMIDRLNESGFDVFLTKADAEYHAAGQTKAAVVRLFGIRRQVATQLDYFGYFERLGGFSEITSGRSLKSGDGHSVIKEIAGSLTAEQWEAFAEYKRFFPVWGRGPDLTKADVAELVSSKDLPVDLHFDDGQTAAVVRHVLNSNSWSPS
jgi:hypothetical protein